jgi:hypothetical protein
MVNFSKPLVFSALLAVTALPLGVQANEGKAGSALKVALWGDEFYADDAEAKSRNIEQTIDSMNKHHVDFTIFAGDTKNGHTLCTDDTITTDIETIFNSLKAPTLYTVGDNEWTDCHRTSNGSMDPLDRLALIRSFFFSKSTSQGTKPIPVIRQGEFGQAYSENSRFVKNNVEFVALHIPGSNNNLVATKKQCTNKSTRGAWDDTTDMPVPGTACAAASEEYEARNAKNIEWLKAAFQEARDYHYAGILIVIQADVFTPFELADGGYEADFLPSLDAKNGYTDFVETLVAETHNYDGQVVLVHGDSHYFRIDKAMVDVDHDPDTDDRQTPNFTRVEVFGSADNSWIEMTVDPKSANVFDFKPVILQ